MSKLRYYPFINKMITAVKLRDNFLSEVFKKKDAFNRPFITIAREPGSGGAPIARKLAKKFRFTLVDEQIVDKIAKSTKKRKEIIRQIDEKSRNKIDEMVQSVLRSSDYVDDVTFIKELIKVILAYASKGHVVILGRAANLICPPDKGLHVNIVALYKVRVKRAIKYENVERPEAREIIAQVEKERRDFVKEHFRKDIRRTDIFDLTINTSYLDILQACSIIQAAFYHKFPRFVRYRALLGK